MFEQRLFHTQKFHFFDFIIFTSEEKRKITGKFSGNYKRLKSQKAGRLEKLLAFARSHFIMNHDSVSLSCASTQHPPRFSESLW